MELQEADIRSTLPINKKKRQANFELLRIIAMLMVITLHYLGKGDFLTDFDSNMTATGYLAWIIESFSIVAVNCYMLISGYFLVESGFKTKRIVTLLCQILFYSILVPICLVAIGVLSVSDLSIYHLLNDLFPIQMDHYWFATAYVLMYLFSPIINVAVKHMKKAQLGATILMLLTVFSLAKTILPFELAIDKKGYDVIWFICIYLVAAYIRLYGISFFDTKKKGFLTYLGMVFLSMAAILCVGIVAKQTGHLQDFVTNPHDYNHVFNLVASVGLFYGFANLSIKEGKLASFICAIAPYTFGVYLLHEHMEARYLWPKWFGASNTQGVGSFILTYLVALVVVFTIGIIVDYLRSLLFKGVGTLLRSSRLEKICNRLDGMMKE